jgi:hypothetical protein
MRLVIEQECWLGDKYVSRHVPIESLLLLLLLILNLTDFTPEPITPPLLQLW